MIPQGRSQPAGRPVRPAIPPEEFRRLAHRAVDIAADYLAAIRGHPVFAPMSSTERAQLRDRPLPEHAVSPDTLIDDIAGDVLSHPTGNGHPRFFAWVISPPSPMGVIAELLAGAMNPNVFGGDQAAHWLEECAIRWIRELIGYDAPSADGILVSGGSMATLTCLSVARHCMLTDQGLDPRRDGLGSIAKRLIIYTSRETHSCVDKAAELMGLGSGAIRRIDCDASPYAP